MAAGLGWERLCGSTMRLCGTTVLRPRVRWQPLYPLAELTR